MSELQLSTSMIQSVQDAIISHDPQAENELVAIQYLAALMGYMLGTSSVPTEQQGEVMEQLSAFGRHVLEDVQQRPPQPPAQEAFGIWKPGDH